MKFWPKTFVTGLTGTQIPLQIKTDENAVRTLTLKKEYKSSISQFSSEILDEKIIDVDYVYALLFKSEKSSFIGVSVALNS